CARWCPMNSKCVNATACRCSPGFSSSSGEIFTNLLENCDDINECAPPMAVSCGKFADCQNIEGSYHCECCPGYELASGAKTFKSESENMCQDVDECQRRPRICKGRTICVNTQGGYTCRCPPGFKHDKTDPNTCSDVNECTSGQSPCHRTTHCLNTMGSYECRCRPGWKPIPGSPNGPNNTICEDVDECSSGQPVCHNSTVCINTLGSYRCRCRHGWELKPGFQNMQPNTTCQEMAFPPWTPPPGMQSQTLTSFFEKIQALRRDFKPTLAQGTIQELIKSVDDMLHTPGDLEDLSLPERHKVATHLLSELERVLRTLAKAMPGASFTYKSPLNTELSLKIQEQGDKQATIGQSHARMLLDWDVAATASDSDPTMMGILSSCEMQKLLAKASLELDPEKKDKLKNTLGHPVYGTRSKLFSAVNLVFLSNTDTEHLDSPVTFAFSHPTKTTEPQQELVCAFWKSDERGGGHWNTTGCWTRGTGNQSTTCQCSHLSSFAILVAHYDIQDPKLELITTVGLSLSLVCLLLCILTFLLVRPIQGSRTTVHLHLCLCLFVAYAIFLAGIKNDGDWNSQVSSHLPQNPRPEGSPAGCEPEDFGSPGLRCRLVAGLLHYCFLAAFCWMSLEGLELYFLVVRVFQGQGLSKRWLYLIGYGVPLIIVAISAAVRHEGYGRDTYCWLNPKSGFLWSFLGPVIFIVLCNAIIFVITVWKLSQKFSEINPDMKKLKKARVLTITAVAQLFVLGTTWVFGLFLFDPLSWVLSYTFTILNCLQGFFLYTLHCLLNKKVREEYRKWAGWVTRSKYSEFSTSSSNQTQVKAEPGV
ncbi:CD97 protein, partial [Crocuta crocuta]